METKLLTIKETSNYLHSATVTVRRLIKAGKLGYKKIGSRYLITTDQIQAYLQSVDVPPTTGGAA
jgi:excisionase family DNA binding protein